MYRTTGLVLAAVVAAGFLGGSPARPAHLTQTLVLAALTPEQAADCERERQALQQRLNQCSDDACRQSVQAQIDAHNARCQ